MTTGDKYPDGQLAKAMEDAADLSGYVTEGSAPSREITLAAEVGRLSMLNRELAAAVQDMLGWMPGPGVWHTKAPHEAAERGRAALAKFRGAP